MILRKEAKNIIDNTIAPIDTVEKISLINCHARILAEDAISDVDIPPFNRATMDGYAVIASDRPGKYEVAEDIPAGTFPKVTLTRGKVSRIMTGAPLPCGADAVVAVESTGGFVGVGQMAEINRGVTIGKNVAPKGEDLNKGDLALKRGVLIGPAEMALLASVGCDPVTVYKKPRVTIISTGDELVEPNKIPAPGQIRNSNAYSMFSQVSGMGIEPAGLYVASDNQDDLEGKIRRASISDFLLVSGGVSAGERDIVPSTLKKCGYDIVFHKVSIKPGKPVLFGKGKDNRFVFGVPGNPVSSIVVFELFIRPAIRKFARMPDPGDAGFMVKLASDYKRRNASREEYVPVKLVRDGSGFVAELVSYHGSGHFAALATANGWIRAPIGTSKLHAGSFVEAMLFPPSIQKMGIV